MGKSKTEKLSSIFKFVLMRKIMKARKKRQCSIRPIFKNRINQGEGFLVKELADDPTYHYKYFRMNKSNFDEILSVVTPDISKLSKHCRPISAVEKLAITLRYLATGNSQISLAISYRISPSSVCTIIREVLSSICTRMGELYLPKPTAETWKTNENGFNSRWNFPNAIGAIDGKHVRIQAPPFSCSTHFNYKNFFSIVLLAVADPNYKFSYVEIGTAGSQSDGGVFSRSALGKLLRQDKLDIPAPKNVGNSMLPHVFLGDDAFPLTTYLMKPFSGKFLEEDNRIFNYRMCRARLVVECSFGILAARWRILHTSIKADLSLVKQIVHAAVILHNFLLSKKDFNCITVDQINEEDQIVEGNWRDAGILPSISRQGSNNHTFNSANIREDFKKYFLNEGSVNWQRDHI